MSGGLPAGWVETALPRVALLNPKSFLDDATEVAFVPMPHVPTNFSDKMRFENRLWGDVKKGFTHFRNDDVIFAKITPCFENGKATIVPNLPNAHGAGSTEFYVLRPIIVPSAFLFYWVKTSAFLKTAEAQMAGTVGQKRVPKSFVESHPFPLPPLNEQKRIVAKLDDIMPRIDSVKERLEKIPAILKRFRQSVLNAAVTGKLTEKWREEHPELESADELLNEKMRMDKQHYASYWNDFDIPQKWICALLKNIADLRLGKMLDSSKNKGVSMLYLRNINVRWFGFDLESLKEIRITQAEKEALSIRPGDVFVCEGGEPGRSAVWKAPESNITFQKALHRVRMKIAFLPDLLVYNLKADADKQKLDELFTGSTIKHFTGRSLAGYPVAIPPLDEQKEIVRQVDKLLTLADKMEEHYQKARVKVDALAQSILAKAFRGELVQQNPDDEPAEKLLQRIQEEKAKMEAELKIASQNARKARRNAPKPFKKQAGEP
ncbi:MAG: restriction endonuclease subunit S [Aminivibrio sp.]|jgi:type I restriction enzyme S subunit